MSESPSLPSWITVSASKTQLLASEDSEPGQHNLIALFIYNTGQTLVKNIEVDCVSKSRVSLLESLRNKGPPEFKS
jgi:hypothetical protein